MNLGSDLGPAVTHYQRPLERGMLRRMRTISLIALPLLLLASACEDKPAAKGTATPAVFSIKPPVQAPKRQKVADTDAKDLLKQFACPNKTNKAACDIFEGFEKSTKWNLTTIQSQDGRYFGKAVVSKGGEFEEHWVFMVVKKVPLNDVSDGDLPLKIAYRKLESDNAAVNNHADRLMRLLVRGNAFTKRNQTVKHVLDYAPSNWDSAAETTGKSTILHIGSGAYVRQGEARTLYFIQVEPAQPGSTTSDGTFALLYPISW